MDIFVGNLPYDIEESGIEEAFAAHGTVNRVKLLLDRETGRSRGIAFVTMDDFKEAQAAIKAMDGQELGGRQINVNQAREREQGPRQGGGDKFRRSGGGGGGSRGRDRY
ncbi:RNA recognition motif domain-containing protein [Cerasicoccus fimbriatus]|uniref:RNA recognition motif domain-containing protein n=1 Tax=Cerasicoccus fimbriatus TaxID=3014554 RepID=UPI0022B30002|nr:RNA-binding protein [Cerasicoccus sp. TK19100]